MRVISLFHLLSSYIIYFMLTSKKISNVLHRQTMASYRTKCLKSWKTLLMTILFLHTLQTK